MTILLVEYRVDDFGGWKAVFDSDPMDRAANGVTRHWIHRDSDDPNHHMVGMEFATHEKAQAFRQALAPVWEMSGAGQAWILEPTESGAPPGREPSTQVNRFVYKLVPPRGTFPSDMSEGEAAIMAQHFAYWERFEQRRERRRPRACARSGRHVGPGCHRERHRGRRESDCPRGSGREVRDVDVRGAGNGGPVRPLVADESSP